MQAKSHHKGKKQFVNLDQKAQVFCFPVVIHTRKKLFYVKQLEPVSSNLRFFPSNVATSHDDIRSSVTFLMNHVLLDQGFHTSGIRHDDSLVQDCGHNGERATTFPMKIRVGDTNCSDVILSGRSFNSANACINL
ncbi:hypothetical protein Hanom_Chr16g01490001 [Helianthus anomalus]